MKTEIITVEELVELGFERRFDADYFELPCDFTTIGYHLETGSVWVGNIESNAETMDDVNELIRLFK